MIKTITLTGGETAVEFTDKFNFFWVRNLGEDEIYASLEPGIVPDADGVVTVPAGAGATAGQESRNTLYLYGSGKVQIYAQRYADCPFFNPAGKGGDGNENKFAAGANLIDNGDFHNKLDGWTLFNTTSNTVTAGNNGKNRLYFGVSNASKKAGLTRPLHPFSMACLNVCIVVSFDLDITNTSPITLVAEIDPDNINMPVLSNTVTFEIKDRVWQRHSIKVPIESGSYTGNSFGKNPKFSLYEPPGEYRTITISNIDVAFSDYAGRYWTPSINDIADYVASRSAQ